MKRELNTEKLKRLVNAYHEMLGVTPRQRPSGTPALTGMVKNILQDIERGKKVDAIGPRQLEFVQALDELASDYSGSVGKDGIYQLPKEEFLSALADATAQPMRFGEIGYAPHAALMMPASVDFAFPSSDVKAAFVKSSAPKAMRVVPLKPAPEKQPAPRASAKPSSGRTPRKLGGNDPEKSLGNFMLPMEGIVPVLDICERLEHALKNPGGNDHKYFGSRGACGLRFDTQEAADYAQESLRKLLRDGDAITVKRVTEHHKNHFWLEVPSELASKSLSEANALTALSRSVAEKFSAGHREEAERERSELLALMDDFGFNEPGHVASQMTRRALAGKETARS